MQYTVLGPDRYQLQQYQNENTELIFFCRQAWGPRTEEINKFVGTIQGSIIKETTYIKRCMPCYDNKLVNVYLINCKHTTWMFSTHKADSTFKSLQDIISVTPLKALAVDIFPYFNKEIGNIIFGYGIPNLGYTRKDLTDFVPTKNMTSGDRIAYAATQVGIFTVRLAGDPGSGLHRPGSGLHRNVGNLEELRRGRNCARGTSIAAAICVAAVAAAFFSL